MSTFLGAWAIRFLICSEDEDVLHAEDDTSYEDSLAFLKKTREEFPDQAWTLVAELEA